jgi:uncharacterized damage-inducible protein DinB
MSCPEIEAFILRWNYNHKKTARALRTAPKDKFDWQPQAELFTLGKMVRHFPEAEYVLTKTAVTGVMERPDWDFANRTAEEIADIFDQSHEKLVAEVATLQAEQLGDKVDFNGHIVSRIDLLHAMHEHEIHHRGQLYTYLHLVGVEPPPLH